MNLLLDFVIVTVNTIVILLLVYRIDCGEWDSWKERTKLEIRIDYLERKIKLDNLKGK